MAHEISWLLEGRVIFVRLTGVQTAEAASLFDREILPYLDNVQAPLVHLVFDTVGLEQLPGIGVLSRFQWLKHPKTGWVVGYPKPNGAIAFITGFVSQLFKLRFRTFDTSQEALAFLQDVDATLPDLSPLMANSGTI
jgi:hypothetical protein